jgi:hypothetical protein
MLIISSRIRIELPLIHSVVDPHQIERLDPDPHQSDEVDPDAHQSDKLDPDPNPHHFANHKPKCMVKYDLLYLSSSLKVVCNEKEGGPRRWQMF